LIPRENPNFSYHLSLSAYREATRLKETGRLGINFNCGEAHLTIAQRNEGIRNRFAVTHGYFLPLVDAALDIAPDLED